jgi:hypothetical protein
MSLLSELQNSKTQSDVDKALNKAGLESIAFGPELDALMRWIQDLQDSFDREIIRQWKIENNEEGD